MFHLNSKPKLLNSKEYGRKLIGNNGIDVCLQAAEFYDKNALLYANRFSEPCDYIDEFLDTVKKGKILDIGCGPGINTNHMHSKGFHVIGIDLSEGMIKLAQESFPSIEFVKEDMRYLNIKKYHPLDGILASYSLIHLPGKQSRSTLVSLYKLLKPSGSIYISVQSGKSQEDYFAHPLIPDERLFLKIFSEEEITDLIQNCGFSIMEQYTRGPTKGEFNFNKLIIIANKN